ncbi:MAG: YitT family protein [Muribaculaceae bacterium]|nr:YitT family protein [Muribaculaceae bacterium]
MTKFTKGLWLNVRDYFFIVFGILLYGFGFSAFLNPEGIVIGGMAGLGQDVYFLTMRLFGWGMPVAVTMYIVNLTLLAFAYKIVGKQFVIRTVFGATVISLVIGFMVPFFPQPLVQGQTFLNVILGGILCGVGVGMAFVHNGSTAGTDIVAAMVSKRTNVSIGRMIQYTDFMIVTAVLIIVPDASIDKVVFGYVTIFLVSGTADYMINTNRQAVQFTIFSKYWQEIATAINNDANRGCTVINGMGWYSKQEVKMLVVMCRKIESVTIYRIIKSIDKNALVTQANVNGVYGKGFDEMKVKIKPDAHYEHVSQDRTPGVTAGEASEAASEK